MLGVTPQGHGFSSLITHLLVNLYKYGHYSSQLLGTPVAAVGFFCSAICAATAASAAATASSPRAALAQAIAPDSSAFTAYSDITKADAIAWAKAALGDDAVAAAEAAVAAQIAEQKNPTAATGVPW